MGLVSSALRVAVCMAALLMLPTLDAILEIGLSPSFGFGALCRLINSSPVSPVLPWPTHLLVHAYNVTCSCGRVCRLDSFWPVSTPAAPTRAAALSVQRSSTRTTSLSRPSQSTSSAWLCSHSHNRTLWTGSMCSTKIDISVHVQQSEA